MTERKFPPGLIERTVIQHCGDYVIVQETWDVTVPGCPMLVFKTGTWPMERLPDVRTVTRRTKYPRHSAADLELK